MSQMSKMSQMFSLQVLFKYFVFVKLLRKFRNEKNVT